MAAGWPSTFGGRAMWSWPEPKIHKSPKKPNNAFKGQRKETKKLKALTVLNRTVSDSFFAFLFFFSFFLAQPDPWVGTM
jgi:hypothetical protein